MNARGRAKRNVWKDTKAVSPVIAVLILIIVAVVGAVAVGLLQTGIKERAEGQAEFGDVGTHELKIIGGPGVSMMMAGPVGPGESVTSDEAPEGTFLHEFAKKHPEIKVEFLRECCGFAMYALPIEACDMGIGRRFPTDPEKAAYPELQFKVVGKAPIAVIANLEGPFGFTPEDVDGGKGSNTINDTVTSPWDGNLTDITDISNANASDNKYVVTEAANNGNCSEQVFEFNLSEVDTTKISKLMVKWEGNATGGTIDDKRLAVWNDEKKKWENRSTFEISDTDKTITWIFATSTDDAAKYINSSTNKLYVSVAARNETGKLKLATDLIEIDALFTGETTYKKLQDIFINQKPKVSGVPVKPVVYAFDPSHVTLSDWEGKATGQRPPGEVYGTSIQGMFSLYLMEGPSSTSWILGGAEENLELNKAIGDGTGYKLANTQEEVVDYVANNDDAVGFVDYMYAWNYMEENPDEIVILGLDDITEPDEDPEKIGTMDTTNSFGGAGYVTGFGGPMFTPVMVFTYGEPDPYEQAVIDSLQMFEGVEVLTEHGFLAGENIVVSATCPFHTE